VAGAGPGGAAPAATPARAPATIEDLEELRRLAQLVEETGGTRERSRVR
jgi:hypothetical protein